MLKTSDNSFSFYIIIRQHTNCNKYLNQLIFSEPILEKIVTAMSNDAHELHIKNKHYVRNFIYHINKP